jgi:nitrogen fixation protein NifU and related proteins
VGDSRYGTGKRGGALMDAEAMMPEQGSGPYGSVVREHFRRPRNQGALPNATRSAEGVNPLCGDRVRIAVTLDERGQIAEARFVANACAICVAAASLLTEHVQQLPASDAMRVSDEEMLMMIGAGVPVGRKRCATLPLEVLRRALAAA